MKQIKYILKIIGLVFLMSLAAVGIGMTGAAPTFFKIKRKDKELENTEQTNEEEEDREVKEVKFG